MRRRASTRHLGECGECRENWMALQHTMTLVDSAEAPDAPEGFRARDVGASAAVVAARETRGRVGGRRACGRRSRGSRP